MNLSVDPFSPTSSLLHGIKEVITLLTMETVSKPAPPRWGCGGGGGGLLCWKVPDSAVTQLGPSSLPPVPCLGL